MMLAEQLKPGAIVRFEDGSTWDVLSIDNDNVTLSGPRPCRGISTVSLEECLRDGECMGEVKRRKPAV